jgi:hypothetical protein
MLLERLHTPPRTIMAMGQLALVAALVGQRFVHPHTDFWRGFVEGLCGTLLGVSIVLNLRGLMLVRRQRRQGG